MPGDVEVLAVQYPGREDRLDEPAITDMPQLVGSVADALAGRLDRPYAVFGHSLGALIGYELALELRHRGARVPLALMASGRRAPHLGRDPLPPAERTDQALVERLRRLDGTSSRVLDRPELLAMMLPALRADLTMADGYHWVDAPPLACPIFPIAGDRDPHVSAEELALWRLHTIAPMPPRMLPGDHFSILADGSLVSEVADLLRAGVTRL
jgi:surfactin synthase thioesterase subunit